MQCYNKKGDFQKSLQIFQKGIFMSITSIKELRNRMEEKFNFKYIITHRTNQDCLENFFVKLEVEMDQTITHRQLSVYTQSKA